MPTMPKTTGKAAAPAEPEKRPRGRPPVPDDLKKSETLRARVTQEEAGAWDDLGGSEWLRRYLGRYLARQKKAAPAKRPRR